MPDPDAAASARGDGVDRGRWDSTVVLGDGTTAQFRLIGPSDADQLRRFHARQSPLSVYRRYFSPKPELTDADIARFTTVDLVQRAGLVALRGGELLGWATYARWPGRNDADAAFMVDDDHHGLGIATLLLEHLAGIAKGEGIDHFTAEVLADNRGMLSVFTKAGWPVERRVDSGVIEVDFAIADTVEFLDSVGRREQRADSRAMTRVLIPNSIALIGASDRPGSIGSVLWYNLRRSGRARIHPVNPNRDELDGVACWPAIGAVPDDVALAVVAVPAEALADTLRQCAAAHVRGAVVITEGDDDVAAVVEEVRAAGLRVIGPSSMGIATPLPDVDLNALLIPDVETPTGNVALSMQSGSLGASVLRRCADLQIGISWFVSLGDRTDVSGNELLQFWDDDEHTAVIGMYTESIGSPRRFGRIARRVSRRRPIVAVRTGIAAIGPASSALYRHCGVIEVPTVSAMLDAIRVLSSQPVLRGPNVAVIGNSRSPIVLADAALRAAGLVAVTPAAGPDWRADPADYAAAIAAAQADPLVDALFVIHAPAAPIDVGRAGPALGPALADVTKPVVVVALGSADGPLTPGSPIPRFLFPEQAAAALGRSYAYGRWLATDALEATGTLTDVDDDARASAGDQLQAAIRAGATTLEQPTLTEVLSAYGIVMPATRIVAAADAVAAADELGFPVAVKAVRRHIGRSVGAGIGLDLEDATDVAVTIRRMTSSIGDDAASVIVQQMVEPGVDLRVMMTTDPAIGPLLRVGVGGRPPLPIADSAPSLLAPLTEQAALRLIADAGVAALLDHAGVDHGVFADLVERLGHLAADHEELATVDLNPVIVTAAGCVVTDADVTLTATSRAHLAVRRL